MARFRSCGKWSWWVMRKAADLIESQFPHRNRIRIKSMDKRITTNVIMDIARDLEHEGRSGRNHHTTWAKGKGRKERRRASNAMGYVSQQPWPLTSVLDSEIINVWTLNVCVTNYHLNLKDTLNLIVTYLNFLYYYKSDSFWILFR